MSIMRTFQDIKGRLVQCGECDERVLLLVGNTLYPNARGRRCWRWSKIAENEATVVGFSKEYDTLIRVKFEGQKVVKSCAFSHFHQCQKR